MMETEKVNNSNYSHNLRAKVLGYPVDLLNFQQAKERLESLINQKKGAHVVTINPEMIIQARKNHLLSKSLCEADLNVPDGVGVMLALKIKGVKINSTVPGIELSESALKYCAENGLKVAFLGSKGDIIQLMLSKMQEKYPGLDVCYYHDGYFSENDEELIAKDIVNAKPSLLLVALGVPKQEIWIKKYRNLFVNTVMIGVGGSFDVWSGNVKRAPEFFRKFGCEWLYRLISQPYRAKRILIALPLFVLKVLIFDRK